VSDVLQQVRLSTAGLLALPIPTPASGWVLIRVEAFGLGLYIAFALPIILRIKAGSRFEPGAWSLGRHYRCIVPIAVAWIATVCVLFLLPVSPHGVPGAPGFDWNVVNYAPLTVGSALILFGGWYLISARHWFTGPLRDTATTPEASSHTQPPRPLPQLLPSPHKPGDPCPQPRRRPSARASTAAPASRPTADSGGG
jgi:hypothetical protein